MPSVSIRTVQQQSRYNIPCGDLLDEGRRREYLDIAVPLHKACIEGDLEAAKAILQLQGDLVGYSINENLETPLHVAAGGHSLTFVRYLLSMMDTAVMELQNIDGNTAFCLAVISGNVRMAQIMLEKNRRLLVIRGSQNMMPLHLAAFYGFHDMVAFLYVLSDRMMDNRWTEDERSGVLLKCVEAGIFDVAIKILDDHVDLPLVKHSWDVLSVLARKPEAFHVRSLRTIAGMPIPFLGSSALTKVSKATVLLRLIWKRIMEKHKDVIDDILRGPMNMERYPNRVLFIAAKLNNSIFLAELLREYPTLIWKRNDHGQTMLHTAVGHRHRDIYSLLLYEIGSKSDLITGITDKSGNNILHLVGNYPKNKDDVSSPFQMHTELLWYKEVEGVLPPSFREVKNKDGQTPQQLFRKNHRKLLADAMNWIYNTINLSMVVSALVCTIGFSVVYSVPGGFDTDNGFPVFLRSRYFIAFIWLVALSFILSSSSILIFLSIIVPALGQTNTELLIKKWVIGQAALLSSVTVIIIAFVFSFVILYRNVYKISLYIFYGVAVVLMYIYVTTHFSLYMDLLMSIFHPRYLFRQSFRVRKIRFHRKPDF